MWTITLLAIVSAASPPTPAAASPALAAPAFAGQQGTSVPASATAPDQPALRIREGRLDLKVRQRSLDSLLESIEQASGVPIFATLESGGAPVSIEVKDVPLDEALRKLLNDYDAFFLYTAQTGAPARLAAVWVYPRNRGRRIKPVPAELWASTRELEADSADSDPDVRSRALMALIERQGQGARAAVLRALEEDRDPRVRSRVLNTALARGVELPPAMLMDLLSDTSETVRFLALEALAEHPDAIGVAQRAVNDPSEHVRNKAGEILRRAEARSRSGFDAGPQPLIPQQARP